MAPISYYYLLCVALVAGVLLLIINIVSLRKTGRSTFGQVYPVGGSDYKNIINNLANKRNLAIAIVVELFLLANLIWSALVVWRLDTQDSRFLLAFAPIAITGLFAFTISRAGKQFQSGQLSGGKSKKAPRKNAK